MSHFYRQRPSIIWVSFMLVFLLSCISSGDNKVVNGFGGSGKVARISDLGKKGVNDTMTVDGIQYTTDTAIFIRDGVALVYRHLIKKQIYGQGIGRLNQEAVFALAHEDIVALAVFLGDKKYFMGENPTSIDASVYGFLINIIGCPIESPIKETALEQTQLVAYCQRMQNQYFPECGDLKL